MDQLSRYLYDLGDGASALVPRYSSRLLRLFPVLSRVTALKQAAEDEAPEIQTLESPQESQRQALKALREIFAKITDRRDAVVLWIDDAQWSDGGSARVLEELLSPPDPPRLLVALTYRSEKVLENPFLGILERVLTRLAGGRSLEGGRNGVAYPEPIELGGLSAEDAALMVEAAFPDQRPERLEDIDEIVAETRGSPFLISELSSHLRSAVDAGRSGSLRFPLEDAIRQRLHRLEVQDRALVRMVAISGRPLELDLALQVAGVASGGQRLIADLCARTILKRVSALDRETLETRETLEIYHDRIRETLLEEMRGTLELRDGHGRLAEALRKRIPEALARELAKPAAGPTRQPALGGARRRVDGSQSCRDACAHRSSRRLDRASRRF